MELAASVDSPPSLKRYRDDEDDARRDTPPGPHSSANSTLASPMTGSLFNQHMSPNLGNVYPSPAASVAPESLPFNIGDIGVPPGTDPNTFWGTSAVATFLPADAAQASQPPVGASETSMAGTFPEMPGTDTLFEDPNFWMSQAPSYLPPSQGAETAMLTDEALGLWSFAPPTFG